MSKHPMWLTYQKLYEEAQADLQVFRDSYDAVVAQRDASQAREVGLVTALEVLWEAGTAYLHNLIGPVRFNAVLDKAHLALALPAPDLGEKL